MFRFIKKVFFMRLTILSNFTSFNSLSCISTNNQACKSRPGIINVHNNNPVFHPVFRILFFTINIGIAASFVYYKYLTRNKENISVLTI